MAGRIFKRALYKLAVFTFILTVTFYNNSGIIDAQSLKSKQIERNAVADPPSTSNLLGNDGDYTVTAANTVLNQYAVLAANVSAGATSFSVTNINDLNSAIPQLGPIAAGDLLMIIQMQGATIDTTDTASYGTITNLNGAGNYEFVTIGSISGNTITINGEGCITGLRRSYSTAGRTQVIRVPQFRNLTINSGASVVPSSWDGTRGGVVALQASQNLIVNGQINAVGRGFRGGAVDNVSADAGTAVTVYRSAANGNGGEKGESIAGSATTYDTLNGRYGRGAPANGGGGGNSHNAGGGGGANGNNGNTYSGAGVMPGTPAAWSLDPESGANSSGGGRGGYSYSANNQDANLIGPGNALWSGNNRRQVGGRGGRPLSNNPAQTIFMGGGGGAGDGNNNAAGAGGNGGGIVHLQAAVVSGSGTITANGANGASTTPNHNDAPGGGGGGGTIIVSSVSLVGVTLSANGGNGGNQGITGTEAEGPGGGGGGGYIAVKTGSPTRTTNGGSGGTTTSSSLTEFLANGATAGATGQSLGVVTTLPICVTTSAGPSVVTGRVVTAFGRGIVNAQLTLYESRGGVQYARTNSFGYFRFSAIPAGEAAVVSVRHSQYRFANPSVFVNPVDAVTEILLVAEP
ncbi:MAG TPA: carboxypeptidase-like regulatory domain-containing protein [Pyrinomonadaceae bacterium]|nr:carboxypeptidase-like regulatory domain-containing protein [Pyrinomonadaceae bacterium]